MPMTTRSIAETYHELTKYTPESVRKPHKIDWNNPPLQFKPYETGHHIDLERYLPLAEHPLTPEAARFAAALTAEEESLAKLSHLLYLTNGVTAVVPYPERNFLMRSAPSAGGLYPTELYVVTRGYVGLADGIYNFQINDHSLIGFLEGDRMADLHKACFEHPALEHADLAIVATAVFFRSAWRYADRAYRRILLDSGHVLGNLEMAAPWFDRIAMPIGGFFDDEVNDLLFLEHETEETLAVIALSKRQAITEAMCDAPTALPSDIELGPPSIPPGQRLEALHEASKIHALPKELIKQDKPDAPEENPYKFAFGENLGGPPIDWEQGISDAIVTRRSTRAFSGEPMTRMELAALLEFTYRPDLYDDPRINAEPRYFDRSLLETFIAASNIEGLDPGCYHYDPQRRELRQIRFKNFSEDIQYLCLGQELGGKASAVVFHTVDLAKAVDRYGERAYRYLHMDAGHLGERLNIACMQLALGVSGIGGFYDDQVNDLLGIPQGEAVIYITTLGRPTSIS